MQYPHLVIEGKVFRVIELEAADTREAGQHVSAERPLSAQEQRVYLKEVAR